MENGESGSVILPLALLHLFKLRTGAPNDLQHSPLTAQPLWRKLADLIPLHNQWVIMFQKTKDMVRVSLQEYLFTGSSKATSSGFCIKKYGYQTSWRGANSTPGTYLNSTLVGCTRRGSYSAKGGASAF